MCKWHTIYPICSPPNPTYRCRMAHILSQPATTEEHVSNKMSRPSWLSPSRFWRGSGKPMLGLLQPWVEHSTQLFLLCLLFCFLFGVSDWVWLKLLWWLLFLDLGMRVKILNHALCSKCKHRRYWEYLERKKEPEGNRMGQSSEFPQ